MYQGILPESVVSVDTELKDQTLIAESGLERERGNMTVNVKRLSLHSHDLLATHNLCAGNISFHLFFYTACLSSYYVYRPRHNSF